MTYALLYTFDTDLYADLDNTRFFLPMRTRPSSPWRVAPNRRAVLVVP